MLPLYDSTAKAITLPLAESMAKSSFGKSCPFLALAEEFILAVDLRPWKQKPNVITTTPQ